MQMAGSTQSASVIVPLILKFLSVRSVCDVGCGVGTWLSVFADLGISDFLGLDGNYIDSSMLQIPPAHFRSADLEKPLRLERTFDLAVSLEVAEHLSPSRAESFVEDLTRIAPAVLFSAAIPNQGGVNHINEQWPSWWAKFFVRKGYAICDNIRSQIWGMPDITPCYRQNIMLFARQETIKSNPLLTESYLWQIDIAHPEFYSRLIPADNTRLLARYLWWAVNRDVRAWFKIKR